MSKTIYYACKYAPLELFAGYGATFSALDPLAESFSCAERCAHANLCGYAKAVLEQVEQSGIRALVLTNCCLSPTRALRPPAPALRGTCAGWRMPCSGTPGRNSTPSAPTTFLCTPPTPRVRI